jgi:hypothetical protein
MKKILFSLIAAGLLVTSAQAQLIISQYVETDSGTTPKGLEIWNPTGSAFDFSVTNLQIFQGTNGGSPSALTGTLVNSGTLGAGEVLVIGSSDIGTYLTGEGLTDVTFVSFGFAFNGDDSVQLRLGGTTVDTIGIAGSDPGSSWSGGGVSTSNQSIELLAGITTGNAAGFTDPSTRFQTASLTPSSSGGLAGFGIAPIPEPSSFLLFGAGLGALALLRRKK